MKRVYHLVTHLRLGAGRYIVDLAVEQLRRGDGVFVCLSGDAEGNWKSDPALVAELQKAGVSVIVVGDTFHRNAEGLRAASRCLKDYARFSTGNSIVHSHTATGILVAKWAGAPTVVSTCHGWNPTRPEEQDLQDAIAFTMADGITSPSTYWAERVNRLAGIGNVKVLPYGLDLARYPQDSRPQRKRQVVARPSPTGRRTPKGPDEGPPSRAPFAKIVCLAELTVRKGQDILIAAMPGVWKIHPDVELDFVGDGDAREALQTQAHRVDRREGRIHFRGFIEQPYKLLRNFDLMCLPTRSDNQPISIVEAMLAGLPVVSTTAGGIPEQVAMGSGGICVPPDDVEALADALITQLEAGPPGDGHLHGLRRRFDIRMHALELDRWYGSVRQTPAAFCESLGVRSLPEYVRNRAGSMTGEDRRLPLR